LNLILIIRIVVQNSSNDKYIEKCKDIISNKGKPILCRVSKAQKHFLIRDTYTEFEIGPYEKHAFDAWNINDYVISEFGLISKDVLILSDKYFKYGYGDYIK
jgi:hypothetical protein